MPSLIRLHTAAVTLLMLSLLSACVSSSVEPPTESHDQHDDGTLGIVQISMNPTYPVTPPFGQFDVRVPSSSKPDALLQLLPPAQLPESGKRTNFSWGELYRNGSDFSLLLPYNNVMPGTENDAVFSPQFDPALGLSSAAYCLFDYSLPGFSISGNDPTVGLGLLLPAVQKVRDVWVGLANFQKNTWDWFPCPEDNVLTVESLVPYESSTGRFIIAILGIGNEQFSIDFTAVGKMEERGTGDLGPAPPGLYTLLPNFASILFLPDIVDLSPDCAPINDQGGIGSCTGFGTVDGAFNYELGQTYGGYGWDFSDPFNRCSPRFVYNQTGVDLGGTCPTGGRNTNDVGTWLLTNGTATEQNAPYGSLSAMSYNCGTSWSAEALTDASLLVPDSKTFIGTDIGGGNYKWTDADIAIAKNVLKNLNHPIVFRTYLDSNFDDVNYASGATWEYNGSSIGGHCMCIVGYNTGLDGGTGAFKVRNSWGTDFGDNGYCWISFDSFRSNTAGVYGYYFTEDCDSAVVSRFTPGTPWFFVCRFWIDIFFIDRVVLHWEPDPQFTRYAIYRDQLDQAIGFGEKGDSVYEDMTVDDYDAHVYWIVGIDDMGAESEPSKPVVGWRLPPPG